MIFLPNDSSSPSLWPDLFALISSIVASLAWPVAVIFLVMKFRPGIASILEAIKERMPLMERFKTPWLDASWSTAAVKDLSREVETFGHKQPFGSESSDGVSEELARLKPSAGVIDAFLEVERQTLRYLKAVGWNQSRLRSPAVAFRRKSDAPVQLKNAVTELTQLRNAAAHGAGDISLESALEYTYTAAQVAREIELLADDALAGLA